MTVDKTGWLYYTNNKLGTPVYRFNETGGCVA